MGRTLPSTTQMVFRLIAELEPFYGTLRRSDQLILDKFIESVLQHRPAIANTDSLLPMEVLPFVILLEERKNMNKLSVEREATIVELDNEISRFLPAPE